MPRGIRRETLWVILDLTRSQTHLHERQAFALVVTSAKFLVCCSMVLQTRIFLVALLPFLDKIVPRLRTSK